MVAPGESSRERARRGVREWVRASGRRTAGGLRRATPYGIFAFLTASAIAPVVAPTLGATGEFAAALNQLGGMGSGHLTTVLSDTATRLRSGGEAPSAEQWRDALAEALAERLAADEQPAVQLRLEVGEVLRAVDAVAVAMAAATAEDREFQQDLAQELGQVQQELVTQGGTQRQQIDLTRRSLVAVTELRQEVMRALRGAAPAEADDPAAEPSDVPCPYPGLASFQPEDAQWFSGRERLLPQLLARLTDQLTGAGPLLVVGVSGAGKSSVLQAGLLPALGRGELPGSADWPWLSMTPGRAPLAELVARTASLAGVSAVTAQAEIRRSPENFGALVAQAALASGAADARLVLVVDQFEEVFTHGADPAEQAAFATALTRAAPAVVVIAVRADFYPQCTDLAELAPVLADRPLVVGQLTASELRRVVVEPAERAGLTLESGLVELLLADLGADRQAGYSPGALPLLAHALRATWQRRRDRTLTVAGYRSSGGIQHALAETAERIFASLDETGRAALRTALLSMVTVADGDLVVRRRVDRTAVDAAVASRLVRARLATADEQSVEISHEALLDGWPRLAGWVEQERQNLVLRQRLGDAARDWAATGDDSGLYRGARLAAAQEWAQGRPELSADERRFLAASAAAAEASLLSERQRARKLRRLAVGLTAALVAVALAGIAALVQTDALRRQQSEALSRQYAAESLLAHGNSDAAMRLALDAWVASPTAEARGALLSVATYPYAGQFGSGPGGSSVAVTSDGALAAVGHADGTVQLWDTADRAPVGEPLIASEGEYVNRMAFSPDGELLATTDFDWGGIRVWRVPEGELVRALPGFAAADWLPTGQTLVGTSLREGESGPDCYLAVWDVATGEELAAVSTGDEPAGDIEISPDGAWAATGFGNGTAAAWDLATGERLAAVDTATDALVRVAVSPAGELATSSAYGRIELHPVGSDGQPRVVVEDGGTTGRLRFTPDGYLLATGRGQDIQLYELATDDKRALRGHSGPSDVAVSADGRTVVATGLDGPTTMWHRATYWLPSRVGAGDVAFGPGGRRFAVAQDDGAVQIRDTATRSGVERGEHGALARRVAYAPDGTLASTAADGSVRVMAPDGEERAVLRLDEDLEAWDVAFSPDGSLLAVTGNAAPQVLSSASRIYLWEVDSLRARGWWELTWERAFRLAFTADGRRLFATTISVGLDAELPAEEWGLPMGGRSALRSWRTDDLVELGRVDLGPGSVLATALSPDGRTLALAGEGRRIQLRELAGASPGGSTADEPVREFGDHASAVRNVIFSPDGRTVATSTVGDAVIRLWDVTTGALVASLTGFDYAPNSLAFSPDGRLLASAGPDGVGLWMVDPAEAVARLCQVLTDPMSDEPAHPACP